MFSVEAMVAILCGLLIGMRGGFTFWGSVPEGSDWGTLVLSQN
jgi:hypothetical protein